MTLGPSPTDSGQAVCASFLSHLLICGEHCRAWSGSNLTFQTHCITGCSGYPAHLIPGVEPGSTGPGGGSSSSSSSWMPGLPGQLRKLQGRSPTLLSESPAWIYLQLAGVIRREQNNISAEIKRLCCSDLSNYLPLYFHIIISKWKNLREERFKENGWPRPKRSTEGRWATEVSNLFLPFPKGINQERLVFWHPGPQHRPWNLSQFYAEVFIPKFP